MIKIIRTTSDEDNPSLVWARIATLNDNREAVVHVISAETNDIEQYISDNEDELSALILANGHIDKRLTDALRTRDARRSLRKTILNGKTLEQAESYIDKNVSNLASAKSAMRELAGQIWMLYQIIDRIQDE